MGEIDNGAAADGGNQALLVALCDSAFDGSVHDLAVALGRPNQEVFGWLDGSVPIDEDALIKARALAEERGVISPTENGE